MLAIAPLPPTDDNWNSHQSTMNVSRPPAHSSNSTSASLTSSTTPHHSAREQTSTLASAPMLSANTTNGTVVPSHMHHTSSPSKPLARSKSRGGSVGGFVHGIVKDMQASLRNVGHKSVQSVPANGYHSDHPPPSKQNLFKSKASVSPTNSDSPEGPTAPDRPREQPSPTKLINKALARSQSRGRAYESEGDNHTIGSIRHSRPSYPHLSTNFSNTPSGSASASSERVSKANGHTHLPLSPLSRENSSTTQSITGIASTLSRSNRSHSTTSTSSSTSQPQSPPSPNLIPPSYTIRGPVPRSAARAILELDAIPPTELLKILAALLEQIAAANDALRAERAARGEETWDESNAAISAKQEADLSQLPMSPESPPPGGRSRSQRRAMATSPLSTSSNSNTPIWNQLTGASRVALSSKTATLSFHARHVPQISLEAYLLRILKYCPTTNATFVAVLVYFDRMCRMAANVEQERVNALESNGHATPVGLSRTSSESSVHFEGEKKTRPPFAIDSFNVHRLVIAGVTVASKFFSDVFYTNSRYAKVGGLPQGELNQLELQFLLLNDFSLVIPPEELARYAAQLLVYAQGRGTTLKPEGLGKGKLGKEAKVVLGLEPEPEPEPMDMSPTLPTMPYTNGFGPSTSPPSRYSTGAPPMHSGQGQYRPYDMAYMHSNHSVGSSMDMTHDSESETGVSTDEDSTIKARSGSESEASEWGPGSIDGVSEDGGETETEGEGDDEDDEDEDVGFYERREPSGSGSRVGRPMTKPMERRPR